ncbi:N-acetylmuramoyl-L-alanine amidase [Virgibacillus salexigens]|uniref:N-acetylmuramoyl-L-alanine amidase n=1 Tax=Virgibacillus massiliensis TaxID=1462526 RepID=UPI00136A7195|nr:N-acetylmuramoyl-L-alanine amidase [Virgibacillus massiliensis]MYL43626.1 SH3 domain-containing protein [Virgibacillus massiliensis]
MRVLFSSATIAIISLFLFTPFAPSVFAEKVKTYEAGTSNLNVRSSPSHDAPIIGKLQIGDQVRVFQKSFGWVQTYYGGKKAWVASQYLFQPDSKTKAIIQVASTQNQTTKSQNKVDYSEKVKIYEAGTSNLNVRSSPSHDAPIIGKLQIGDQVRVFQKSFGWVQTYYGGKKAWIASQYLLQSGSKTKAIAQVASSTQKSIKKEQNKKTETISRNNFDNNKGQATKNGSLKGYNIVIDPGHGGRDSGAIGINGVLEKETIMSVVDSVVDRLRKSGANVILTRNSDHFISLQDRVYISNSYNTHAFLSLHYNAHPLIGIQGLETHYYSGGENYALASSLQSKLEQYTSLESRGVKESNYFVLRESEVPSALIELGFITNPNDLSIIQTEGYQNSISEAISDGVKKYFRDK